MHFTKCHYGYVISFIIMYLNKMIFMNNVHVLVSEINLRYLCTSPSGCYFVVISQAKTSQVLSLMSSSQRHVKCLSYILSSHLGIYISHAGSSSNT